MAGRWPATARRTEARFGDLVHANQRERGLGILSGRFNMTKRRMAARLSGSMMAGKGTSTVTQGADMAGAQGTPKSGEREGSPAWRKSQMGAPSNV